MYICIMKTDTQKQVDIHNNNNDREINLKYSVSYLIPSIPQDQILGTELKREFWVSPITIDHVVKH